MTGSTNAERPVSGEPPDRREFLSFSSLTMAGGLVAGYGTLAAFAGRYLYPTGERATAWLFVTRLDAIGPGASLQFETPTGVKIVVARQAHEGTADDFVALSRVCPHLGCQVHWEPHNQRFFCPCHNGVFDPQGKATAGPPADANQSLARYDLKVEDDLLFIKVPVVGLKSPEDV